jgi:hypothetical protein
VNRLRALALAALLGGCMASAATGGKHDRWHRQACREDRYLVTAASPACTWDSECALCHDGSACGVVLRSDEVARRGDACNQRDAAMCECASVHCCAGHCVSTVFCPR